jgi:hypothetical protein
MPYKDKALTGAAGVFYAASMFSLRGMIALPTIRNTAGYDIIVTSRNGSQHANVQVKTASGYPDYWPICQKLESVRDKPNDFYVLLRRAEKPDLQLFEGFMLTGQEMKAELERYIVDNIKSGNTASIENFPLCLCLANPDKIQEWQNRWLTWTIESRAEAE